MVPRANAIIQLANETAARASARVVGRAEHARAPASSPSASRSWRSVCALSWLIGRSITRPLNGLADGHERLANGDTEARIPATQARDEIGEMARSVIVFRDTTIERERLAATQAEAAAAGEQRSATIATDHRAVQELGGERARQAARRLA